MERVLNFLNPELYVKPMMRGRKVELQTQLAQLTRKLGPNTRECDWICLSNHMVQLYIGCVYKYIHTENDKCTEEHMSNTKFECTEEEIVFEFGLMCTSSAQTRTSSWHCYCSCVQFCKVVGVRLPYNLPFELKSRCYQTSFRSPRFRNQLDLSWDFKLLKSCLFRSLEK